MLKINKEKVFIGLLVTVEAIWLALLFCCLLAFVQAITAHAEEPKMIMGGEYVIAEIHTQDNAIDITEPPTHSNTFNTLEALDALDNNPYLGITFTDEEAEELRWVLALEAQGEGFEGEILCCSVIFNRLLSKRDWGESIHDVLSKRGQFSTYKRIGSRKAWATPGQMEDDVISECMRRGPSEELGLRYVYFDSKGGVNGKDIKKIGNHWFGAE